MKISEVAARTGATRKAIRHYEDIGLLQGVGRVGTYRHYSANDVNTVRLIRTAQKLGFKLSELTDCFKPGVSPSWQHLLAMIEQKQHALTQQIALLNQQSRYLAELKQEIQNCPLPSSAAMDMDCTYSLTLPHRE